jgi:hypothetical protein
VLLPRGNFHDYFSESHGKPQPGNKGDRLKNPQFCDFTSTKGLRKTLFLSGLKRNLKKKIIFSGEEEETQKNINSYKKEETLFFLFFSGGEKINRKKREKRKFLFGERRKKG